MVSQDGFEFKIQLMSLIKCGRYGIVFAGEQILGALENGVSQWPRHEGRFPQVSNAMTVALLWCFSCCFHRGEGGGGGGGGGNRNRKDNNYNDG